MSFRCFTRYIGVSSIALLLLLQALFVQKISCQDYPSTTSEKTQIQLKTKTSISPQQSQNSITSAFSPIVTATCRAGVMTVKVESLNKFFGVVQSRDYRKPQCSGYGENARITFLRINMLAQTTDDDYCGIFINEANEEFSVAIAVRLHRRLELASDKFYMISCGKAGFQNTRNETSLVNLELRKGTSKVNHVLYGQGYTLKAHFSQPDGKFGMRVKRCFSFSDTNNTVQLVDERGCPDKDIMSPFKYNRISGTAEAQLYSMFKFPESNRVHFQCDILVCRGRCVQEDCDSEDNDWRSGARSLDDPQSDALLQQPGDGALMASYSVFVVEPGEDIDALALCSECTDPTHSLVFYLSIAFGILFLVMLIVNLYLCCAMSKYGGITYRRKTSTTSNSSSDSNSDDLSKNSTVQRSEKPTSPTNLMNPVMVMQQPQEFDPYINARTASYGGSQYGSRYTLNGGIKPIPVPYISADNRSSHNFSTSSIKKVHHHQVNGGIPAGNVHATTLSRPSSRAGSRARSRSRSKSRPRSHSRPRNSRQNLNTSHGSSSHSVSNGVPPTSIFPRHHQSSLSGQSHFSHTDSTGRLLHTVPIQRMSRY